MREGEIRVDEQHTVLLSSFAKKGNCSIARSVAGPWHVSHTKQMGRLLNTAYAETAVHTIK